MKINKANLLKALETVKPGLANKEMIEQSTTFCFMNGNLVTFNDEISILYPVKDIELEGSIASPEFYDFVKKSKTEEIDITINNNEILLKSGRSKAGLTLITEITLPVDEIGNIDKWKKLPKDFCKGLQFSIGACSNDMSDPKLTCVHINKAVLESSDNHRLSTYLLTAKVPIKPFLIPANTCNKLVRIKPIEIAKGEGGWIHFRTEDKAVISCRTFEEKYVDFSQHMEVKGIEIEFPKSIIDILDRASIFSKRAYILDESISIHIEKKKLQIKSKSDSGWFKEVAKIDYSGDPIEFSIAPHLLVSILSQTTLATLGDNKILFTGENWKYLSLLKA